MKDIEFSSFRQKTILVIGDIMIDHYVSGTVQRISPEAPIPVLNFKEEYSTLGGAANVARNIVSLGANAILIGAIGQDEGMTTIESLCIKHGIQCEFIKSQRPTTIKTRFISNGHQLLRLDKEVDTDIAQEEVDRIKITIANLLVSRNIDGIILQDYNKGTLTADLIQFLIAQGKEYSIPVFVDPKKTNFFAYTGATVLKPNLKESFEALNLANSSELHDVLAVGRELKKILACPYVVITRGEEGLIGFEEDEILQIKNLPRNVVDVCGAGDAVIATLALCMVSGFSFVSACKIANEAGGIVCEENGVVPVDLGKLLDASNFNN